MLLTLAVLASLVSCRAATGPSVTIKAARDVTVNVELATTDAQRTRGLMWRNVLAADGGMLFAFPDERQRSFWMKNTPLSLDIIFISEAGRIVSVASATKPYSTQRIPSERPSMFVLEVNAGFCESHGIAPGQTVELPRLGAVGGS